MGTREDEEARKRMRGYQLDTSNYPVNRPVGDKVASLKDTIARTFGLNPADFLPTGPKMGTTPEDDAVLNTRNAPAPTAGRAPRAIYQIGAPMSSTVTRQIGTPLSEGLVPGARTASFGTAENNRFNTLSELQQRLNRPGDGYDRAETNRFNTLSELNQRLNGDDATDPLADLEAQIMKLATPVTTPDKWISPYSQDYLNQLGGRITEAGQSARDQLAAAKQDILNNYAMGLENRATENQGFTDELQSNAANIGVNYKDSTFGQRAATDSAFLDQMAQQNQATDLSYNDKLGGLFASIAANLGAAAREGLLTPKQFIPGSTELPAGAREQIDFLKEKYRMLMDQQAEEESGGGLSDLLKITQGASETVDLKNQELVDLVASQSDPALRDYLQTVIDRGGGTADGALKLLAEMSAERNTYDVTGSTDPETGLPVGMGSVSGLIGRMGRVPGNIANILREEYLRQLAQDLLRQVASSWGNPVTNRTLTNKSSNTYE